MTQRISEGAYTVSVECPACQRLVYIPAVLEGVLKMKHSESKLSVAVSAKPIPHACDTDQLELVDPETGEIG